MKKIDFSNGFYAELSSPDHSGIRMIRLYTPDDVMVASMHGVEETFPFMAEGMMYGYFCGFWDCKRKIREKLIGVVDSVGSVDIKR